VELQDEAARLGVSIEVDADGRNIEIQLDAPEGSCWEPGLHTLRVGGFVSPSPLDPSGKLWAWRAARVRLAAMAGELTACTDTECERCVGG
jgi:hypothetical protein